MGRYAPIRQKFGLLIEYPKDGLCPPAPTLVQRHIRKIQMLLHYLSGLAHPKLQEYKAI